MPREPRVQNRYTPVLSFTYFVFHKPIIPTHQTEINVPLLLSLNHQNITCARNRFGGFLPLSDLVRQSIYICSGQRFASYRIQFIAVRAIFRHACRISNSVTSLDWGHHQNSLVEEAHRRDGRVVNGERWRVCIWVHDGGRVLLLQSVVETVSAWGSRISKHIF